MIQYSTCIHLFTDQWVNLVSPVSRMGVPPIVSRMGVPPSAGWGYPHPNQQDGSTPVSRMGYPFPVQVPGQDGGGGVVTLNWNSIACTCYAAGGMPLAFTQEDFLVASGFFLFSGNEASHAKMPLLQFLCLCEKFD